MGSLPAQTPSSDPPFGKQLRLRTRMKRSALQAVGDMTLPLALTSPRVYLTILQTYAYIFRAFEDEFEKRRRVYPRLNSVYFRELLRCDAFERDLSVFSKLVPNADTNQVLPAGKRFVREMRIALCRQPVLVISYSYALYIGLLAAPARTRLWICNAFGLDATEEEGIGIWCFSDTIKNRNGFRKRYDTVLNNFELQMEEREAIFNQVHTAFESLAQIFREVKTSRSYITTVSSLVARFVIGISIVLFIGSTWIRPFLWAVRVIFFPNYS